MSVTEPAGEQAYNFPELLSKLNQTARELDKAIAERDRLERQLQARTWTLPDQPGPEVTAVRDQFGQVFERDEWLDRPVVRWVGTAFADDPEVPDLVLTWEVLFRYHAPLTDVSGAES